MSEPSMSKSNIPKSNVSESKDSPPSHYSLKVIRLRDVTRNSSKVPKFYVKVKLGNVVIKRTHTIENDTLPTWTDVHTFSAPDSSTILNIRVKHESLSWFFWKPNPCVGYIDISISDLLKECVNDEAQRPLFPSSGNATASSTGVIHLCLEAIDPATRAGLDVKGAEKAVQRFQTGTANPTAGVIAGEVALLSEGSDFYRSLGSLLSKLSAFVQVIDAISKIHPYLDVAWQMTSLLYRVVQKQFETDREVVGLVCAMEDAFNFVDNAQDLPRKVQNLERTITGLLKQTAECCLFVQHYTGHGFLGRVLDLSGSLKKIKEFKAYFVKYKEALASGISLTTAFISARMSEKVDALFLAERLKPSETNAFRKRQCLPGTRVDARKRIMDWMLLKQGLNILWLYGVPGSGKSTISMTFAEVFRSIDRLGAFLLFERKKSDPDFVIRTIAYKLASFDSSILSHVVSTLEGDNDIANASAESQFDELILKPLTAAAADMQGPVFVILDALDECGVSTTREDLLRVLMEGLPKLPSNFRFLITSRRDKDITDVFRSHAHSVHAMELDSDSKSSRDDVLSFIRVEMDKIFRSPTSVARPPAGWDWDGKLLRVGDCAAGLFIWGSTAVELVKTSDDPFRKLNDLVSNSHSLKGLDRLYATVLDGSGIAWDDDISKARFRDVLGLILFSKVAISERTIDGILGFPPHNPSRLILSRLQSVLVYALSTPNTPIRLFHTSFADYLTAPERKTDPWFIDVRAQKLSLAMKCFDVVKKSLRFNLCDPGTSHVPKDRILSNQGRIKEDIPPHLKYACLFWAQHYRKLSKTPTELGNLTGFMMIIAAMSRKQAVQ